MNPPHINPTIGSHFDDFLADENILEEVSIKAQQRLLALQLADIMQAQQMTKTSLAARLHTSRSQLDRILDPNNTALTIEVLDRVAQALGKTLHIRFA